jgi:hypothetical protein
VRSPLGITPVFLGAAALTVFPGIWLFGAYNYPYTHHYTFHNRTGTNSTNTTNTTNSRRSALDQLVTLVMRQDTTSGASQTKPVDCLCAARAECGCDDSGNFTVLDSLIGDGTYANLNFSLVNVVDINGTSTIVLNGTLPNGTTTSGGTEDVNGESAAIHNAQSSGYMALVAMVAFMVYFI